MRSGCAANGAPGNGSARRLWRRSSRRVRRRWRNWWRLRGSARGNAGAPSTSCECRAGRWRNRAGCSAGPAILRKKDEKAMGTATQPAPVDLGTAISNVDGTQQQAKQKFDAAQQALTAANSAEADAVTAYNGALDALIAAATAAKRPAAASTGS